ncbi:putative secreted Zn-dependent protease [Spongiibacter sp. IMCC21906]|uniref:DUF922 domain-containing Zn-dependent protease n=1 Tax=Spongiibacter sp. IMCC21906 TaxID=1620392 RepID=UPI00062E0BDB|nr:DUF922 domain-containing protein [Spongiibacter sp. IMCC21906]AKH69127.1 putative secreted Zn-dependent protease [Spongiibacter sp. IMCC21906]
MLIKSIFSQFYRVVKSLVFVGLAGACFAVISLAMMGSWIIALRMRHFSVVMLLLSNVVIAEPEVEVINHYYTVAVDSIGEIETAVEAASPLRGPNKTYHGYTDSQVNWSWWWRKEANLCRISRVESKVTIEYTLPRLETDPRNFRVRGVWSEWFWALKSHENNHGRNAIAIARQGEKAILAVEPHTDCTVIDQRASAIAAGLIEALKLRDAEYDKRTNHGELEAGELNDYF